MPVCRNGPSACRYVTGSQALSLVGVNAGVVIAARQSGDSSPFGSLIYHLAYGLDFASHGTKDAGPVRHISVISTGVQLPGKSHCCLSR